MTEADNGVPTLAPHELTYRVGWEVVQWTPEQITVRAKREIDPADSDGIPQAVLHEVSIRGASDHITDRVGVEHITPEIRLDALTALADLAFNDGLGDMVERPMMVTPEWKSPAEPGKQEVCILIRRRRQFRKWFDELAQFDFADIERYMGKIHGSNNWFHQRRVGVQVMHELRKIMPELEQFDDTPHLTLHL